MQKVYNNIIYISIRYKHRNYKLYKLNCFVVPDKLFIQKVYKNIIYTRYKHNHYKMYNLNNFTMSNK